MLSSLINVYIWRKTYIIEFIYHGSSEYGFSFLVISFSPQETILFYSEVTFELLLFFCMCIQFHWCTYVYSAF